MGRTIGCDLGTGNSCLAVCDNGKVTVILNSEGMTTTPSVVAFDESGRSVGRVAKSQAAVNPKRTVSSVKRFMGRMRAEVSEEEKLVPYKITGEPGEPAQIEIDGKKMFPQEISAIILADLKKSAEAYLGEKVTGIVCCCPAYYNSAQREAVQEACRIAGMTPLRILAEPTSAALAYGIDKNKTQKVFVYDLGSGTFDCSLLHVSDGVFEVLATSGDTQLGGDDWDAALTNFIADEFKTSNNFDVRSDPMALQRLREACEKAKCDLSAAAQTTINIPYITSINGSAKHLSSVITRAKFESICAHLFERLRAPVLRVMQDAKVHINEVNEILLIGGATRMLRAQEICKELFGGKEPNKSISPDLAVCMGAAIQSSVLSGDITDIILLDVTPLSLGVEVLGGVTSVLIPRNTTIPTSKSEVFSTASDNQPAVDIHVLQGERRMASGNRTLGRFQMTGIPLQARGKPQVEVNFDIDANGILSVSAKDKATGKEHRVEIKGSSGLDKSDIDRMMKDAATYEAEDKNRADLIEARNKADGLVYNTESFMRENTKLISAPCHAAVKTAIDNLRSMLDTQGVKAQIEAAMDTLEVANKRMYDECFASAEKAGQAAKPSVSGAVDGEVIEAQFEIKK